MSTEVLRELVDAGVHYGHQRRKWNPRMKPYLLAEKNNIHIINLEETVRQIENAAQFLSDVSAKNGKILFVGCKRQAQDAVREAAEASGHFYVNHRWLGGTLTNMSTIRQSVGRMEFLEKIEKSPDYKSMSKKELAALNRERNKLVRNLEGVRRMEKHPQALVVMDAAREEIAVAEARRLKIPIVGTVDTNADPTIIDYPIAANDDAIRAVRIVLQKLIDPVIQASKGAGTTSSKRIEMALIDE